MRLVGSVKWRVQLFLSIVLAVVAFMLAVAVKVCFKAIGMYPDNLIAQVGVEMLPKIMLASVLLILNWRAVAEWCNSQESRRLMLLALSSISNRHSQPS